MPHKSTITRTVFFLGLVSLLTDMASEMIYPVLPLFLDHIGITVIGIGILEGIAQATAGLSKSYFGRWSDLSLRRLPFVQIRYGLSALSKPFLAFASLGWSVRGKEMGSAIGNYEALNSIATMLASAVGGLIWYSAGAMAFFVLTGVLAIVVIGYMLVFTQTNSALTTD